MIVITNRSNYHISSLFFTCFSVQYRTGVCGFENTDIKIGDIIKVRSPNYPYFYPSNFVCTWQLSAAQSGGSFAIKFITFDIEPNTDILTIGQADTNTPRLAFLTFSSWMPSNVAAVIGEQMIWIEFKSDFVRSGQGFELQVERIKDTGKTF